jgi:hypothetical protein
VTRHTERAPANSSGPSHAARTRRYRQRRSNGTIIIELPVFAKGIERLVTAGFLPPDSQDDRDAIARAVVHAANRGLSAVLLVDSRASTKGVPVPIY